MGSENDDFGNSSSYSSDFAEVRRYSGTSGGDNNDRCATRKVVRSQCRTEEVEPGKYIRKCEKTEQIFKDCVGRPSEMIESNKEYTEEDVTRNMVEGSFPLELAQRESSLFPGLQSDIEAIERNFLGSINRFFEAAEDIKNEFFNSVGVHDLFDKEYPPPSHKRSIPIESTPPAEALPQRSPNGATDLSGLVKDV